MIGHIQKLDALAGLSETASEVRAERIPWHVWSYVAAVSSATLGLMWDISWHMSIGRDTFLTPPHILVYLCGILGGFTAAWLILSSTFSSYGSRATIKMWGFRGPLGAFLGAWGAVAMLTSAPFDDWWHNAYGLDTKILSPPHIVLAFGLLGIRFGALLLVLGEMNRASGALKRRLTYVFLYVGATVLGMSYGTFQEMTTRNYMHSARFYLIIGIAAPLVLFALREATQHKWAMTIVAGIVSTVQLTLLWILPLFPAEPKLGPVLQQVTHFIPQPFPLLVLVPAFVMDVMRTRWKSENRWLTAVWLGPLFVAVLLMVQWPFADFLNSAASRNAFFGTQYAPYFVPQTSDIVRGLYTAVESTAGQFWMRMGLAFVGAILSVRAGLQWGNWMQRIRR